MQLQKRYSKQQLHQETARISWPELERHFARGVLIQVDADMDLVEVATCFANDDQQQVAAWLQAGGLQQVSSATAKDWAGREPALWAVVTAPWILVQERGTDD